MDIFIPGELVDLAIPTEDFAGGDTWYKWSNNTSMNKYLEQGVFPNTKSSQIKFFKSIGEDRLALIVQNKKGIPIGIVSLSYIDYKKRMCDFAIVIDSKVDHSIAGYAALEASARIVQHGFEALGVKRINAGQHIDLFRWQQRLELIGFRFEGHHKNKFVKGNHIADSITIALIYDDFYGLIKNRGGNLWDSSEEMKKRIQALPKESIRSKFLKEFSVEMEDYYKLIHKL